MLGRNDPYLPGWLRWLLGSITFLGLAILILSIVLGVRAGQQQLEIRSRQQIAISLQNALDLQAQGRIEDAFNAYQSVLVLEPDNPTATQGIQALLNSAEGNENLSLNQDGLNLPSVAEQSTSPDDNISTSDLGAGEVAQNATSGDINLFDEAQSAFQASEWQSVIDSLTTLRTSNPQYREDEVTELLYSAYFSQATEYESRNQTEQAVAAYDAAIAVHPNPIGAEVGKELLNLYIDVLTIDETDHWRIIAALEGIYQVDQTYRDVNRRLQAAYVSHGDSLVAEQQWCLATDQYSKAADLDITPGLISKRDRYQEQCAEEGPDRPPSGKPDAPTVIAQTRATSSPSNDGAQEDALATRVTLSLTGTPLSRSTGEDDDTAVALSRSAATVTALANQGGNADDLAETPTTTPTPADTPTSASPASAPSGRILYAARDIADSRSRIFAQPADGSGNASVVVEDGMQPAFRADGARLIYRNERSDSIGLTAFDPGSGLSLRFTDYAEDSFPNWSPEGNRIVFASNREGDRRWRIFTVWAEEGGATTNHSFGETPSWHPSQDLIVYRGCDERGNACGLWTMDGSGGSRKALTTVVQDSHPTWSPDGRYMVFMSGGRDGNTEIYSLATSTGQVMRLTNSPTIDGIPAVSPNSDWVAFLSDRNGTWSIWRVPISGGDEELVAPLAGSPGEWQLQTLQWVR